MKKKFFGSILVLKKQKKPSTKHLIHIRISKKPKIVFNGSLPLFNSPFQKQKNEKASWNLKSPLFQAWKNGWPIPIKQIFLETFISNEMIYSLYQEPLNHVEPSMKY